jgi:formate hydrogenlyase transcriptional activator
MKVNCAAIPRELLESDLFGHEKGAFTGAIAQKLGRFDLANNGTLFLDEVGDMPLELQPKLLRVLQEQEFERLGSTRTRKVDVRLVAATNRDLAELVREKNFRNDLFYRLNVFPVNLPPLRERKDDIPILARFFVDEYAKRMGKEIERIPDETVEALVEYDWPGNVRELQNFIERAVILSPCSTLRAPVSVLKKSIQISGAAGGTLDDAQRDHIVKALNESNWVVGGRRGAAVRLGLKRTTLLHKMQRLGVSRRVSGVVLA